ncbi:tetratricopeptide repeat protein [Myroides odoratimimus]|uniref:tetratricopeptide repeat protein n=1 Tax=Myroides odoratimimus TaxID=76832 RepID=UPI0003545775|nr:tetratricopeptide repeat protein [Myroides odoratimimus]EPH10967.1 hypothetical protein HMPREF9713_02093 [Myroides odoratimimus CCUG 12700]MCA4805203.1 tetratricopeptide repeat protein [Myroides odoratimimus]MDM1510092.1 tetratricopeptide repeat protein [Myroides odoratimimus]MDM1526833.1 tetratricopeptide repeat protein [Myroides odoratimimus]MDM1680074.1 tetratricopeptide repeat protein [Myroides odoratimimus]
MKHIITLFIFVLSFHTWAQTDSWKQQFDKGNALYQKEKYSEAITAFKAIEKQESSSPEVFFNLANAYYKTRDYVNAVYYYEKALKLNPSDTAIETNLNYARKELIDDITIVKQYDNEDILHQSLGKLSVDQWATLATVMAFVVLLCFVVYYLNHSSTIKRISFVLMLVSILVIGGSVYAATFEQKYASKTTAAILFTEKVNLKEDAKNTSRTLKELHEGTKVYILEKKALWIRVKLDDQQEGWIEENTIKYI